MSKNKFNFRLEEIESESSGKVQETKSLKSQWEKWRIMRKWS